MKRKIYNSLCFTVLLPLFLFTGCNFNSVSTLGRCSSTSIEQSKKRGTFISEYSHLKVRINDSIQFVIKQAFLEKQYGQYSYSNPSYTIQANKSQLIMILEQKICLLKGYDKTWHLAVNHDKPDRLSLLFDTLNLPDSISIEALKIDIDPVTFRAGKNDDEKIGQFTLVKMK